MKKDFFKFNSGTIKAQLSNGEKTILEAVDFAIAEGETMALIGRTGSGKTMTALEIMGLLPTNVYSQNAVVMLDGEDLCLLSKKKMQEKLGKEIVYIPQNGSEFLNPSIKIKTQVFDALKKNGFAKEKLASEASRVLSLAGLNDPETVLEKYSFELSGGMAQRVTIALAACANPKLLITDEPTNGLDAQNRENFVRMLSDVFPFAAKIVITHDPRLEKLCDFTYRIGGGEQ